MDPIANMDEQLFIAQDILARDDVGTPQSTGDTARLAELVVALHNWRTTGGFDPYMVGDARLMREVFP
jgi:hypothetical protein